MSNLREQWKQVDAAITAEVAQAQEQNRQTYTAGLIWGAGVLVQEMAQADGLTGPQVEELLTRIWGRTAFVNRHRLAGERAVWTASDHNGNHLYLNYTWANGRTVFLPDGTTWAAIAQRNGAEEAVTSSAPSDDPNQGDTLQDNHTTDGPDLQAWDDWKDEQEERAAAMRGTL